MKTSEPFPLRAAAAGAGAIFCILTSAAPAASQEVLTGGVFLDSGAGVYTTAPGTAQDYDAGDPVGQVGAKVQVPFGAVSGMSAKAVYDASATPTGSITVRILRTPPGSPAAPATTIAQCAIGSFTASGGVKWGTCSTAVSVLIPAGSWLSVEIVHGLAPPPDVAVTYAIAYD